MATYLKNEYSFLKWSFAVGALYFWADEIWTAVSLQSWIHVCGAVAVFNLVVHWIKQKYNKDL